MPRAGLSAAMRAALADETVRPVLIAEIETAGGTVRAWSGIGDLAFNGQTFTGVGDLGGVSPVKETSDLEATGCDFSLSGVKASLIATALGQIRYGRAARLWLGLLDDAGALIADPYMIFSGLTDNAAIEEGAESATITVSAESRAIDLERPRARRYTSEDQHLAHPTDRGFEYVPALQDKEIVFGR